MSLSIILQSLAQLSLRYGPDYAKSIQGGFTTYLTYTASDEETAQFFERRAGRVVETQISQDEDSIDQRTEYNLLNADEIRRMDARDALILSGNQQPAVIRTTPWFESPKLKRVMCKTP